MTDPDKTSPAKRSMTRLVLRLALVAILALVVAYRFSPGFRATFYATALDLGSKKIRLWAIKKLADPDSLAVNELAWAIENPSYEVSSTAWQALRTSPSKSRPTVPILLQIYQRGDRKARLSAFSLIQEIAAPEDLLPFLARILESDHEKLREAVYSHIWTTRLWSESDKKRLKAAGTFDPLLRKWVATLRRWLPANEDEHGARRAQQVLTGLAETGRFAHGAQDQAIAFLTNAKDPRTRFRAIDLLSGLESSEATDALFAACEDPEPEVVVRAISRLSTERAVKARELLYRLHSGPEPRVRSWALRRLVKTASADPRTMKSLETTLNITLTANSEQELANAIDLISELGTRGSIFIPRLIEIALTPEAEASQIYDALKSADTAIENICSKVRTALTFETDELPRIAIPPQLRTQLFEALKDPDNKYELWDRAFRVILQLTQARLLKDDRMPSLFVAGLSHPEFEHRGRCLAGLQSLAEIDEVGLAALAKMSRDDKFPQLRKRAQSLHDSLLRSSGKGS